MTEGGAQSRPSDSDEDRGLQELEAELEKIQAQNRAARKKQDRQQALRRQIDAAKKELAAITGEERDKTKEVQIAFTAVVSPPKLENLGSGQTIVYDKIITNYGDAYCNITGVFVAPVNGLYVFEMSLMTDPENRQYLELVTDGTTIIRNYGHALGAKHIVSSSRTATTKLSRGSKVWIRTVPIPNHGTGTVHDDDIDMKVAFTAVVSPPVLDNLGAGQPIVFDRVITNIGNCYDKIIGIFTAPVKGVYVFEMTLMTDPGWYQYLELVQNDKHVIWNYGQASGQHYSSSRTVTIELAKGTRVWIRTQKAATHGSGKVHGNCCSTFSGWLYTVLK